MNTVLFTWGFDTILVSLDSLILEWLNGGTLEGVGWQVLQEFQCGLYLLLTGLWVYCLLCALVVSPVKNRKQ